MQHAGKRTRQLFATIGTPMVYAAAAIALGIIVPRLEARYFPDLTLPASTGSAVALLSAIASGMLPLTGLVFSLAFVMVQFSAMAYSPRLVTWLTGSAVLRHSLGVFTAAFLYALAALPWIDRGGSGKVPGLTIAVAILLLLVSVVFFVLLVERLVMLQISHVLAYTGDQARNVIALAYPHASADGSLEDEADPGTDGLPEPRQVLVHRGGPAVVQAIDLRRLPALAARHDAVIAMAVAVGDTVVAGMPLLRVHGGARAVPERRLRRGVQLGTDRTFEQDPKYAIRLLVDIAIRALSPAINDPTTAVQALDQIEDLLVRLGRRRLAAGRVLDARGCLRLVYPSPSWEDFVELAFDEIRFYGASSIQVMRRMRALIPGVMDQVPPERRETLQQHLDRVDAWIVRAFADDDDRRDAFVGDRQGLGLRRGRRPA